MIEAEIKVKIDDPEGIRKKITNFKGDYILSLKHADTYFNMPIGLRDFQETDEALRIRNSTEFDKNKKSNHIKVQSYLTYKDKKLDNITKTREEIEIKIDDELKIKNLLLKLGFQEILTVIKERELYEIEFRNERIDVLIDYLPILDSYFLETEILCNNIDKIDEVRELIFDFLKDLGIDRNQSIRKSYLELILEKSR